MKLEDQVCSLELAKKLKKLGVKQESLFYWDFENTAVPPVILDKEGFKRFEAYQKIAKNTTRLKYFYSAFTVAELGNILPMGTAFMKFNNIHWTALTSYNENRTTKRIDAETEADCRAKMLIYLIENELIKQI